MNGKLAGRFLVAMALNLSITALASGAESPVLVTHEVTKYRTEGNRVSIEYLFHVTNRLDRPISSVTLALSPSPLVVNRQKALKFSTLAPHERTDLTLKLEAPASRFTDVAVRHPLRLDGKCLDPNGKNIEFPAVSYPGGGAL